MKLKETEDAMKQTKTEIDLMNFLTSRKKNINYDGLVSLKDETMSDNFEVDLPEISYIQQLLGTLEVILFLLYIDTWNNWKSKAAKILNSRSIYLQNYNYSLIRKTFEKICSHSANEPKKRFQKLMDKINEEQKDCQSEGVASIQRHFDELSSKNYPLSYTQ